MPGPHVDFSVQIFYFARDGEKEKLFPSFYLVPVVAVGTDIPFRL